MALTSPFALNALVGQTALITGGGSGIGLEIAKQFGKHGAKVAIMGRREETLIRSVALLKNEGIDVNWHYQLLKYDQLL